MFRKAGKAVRLRGVTLALRMCLMERTWCSSVKRENFNDFYFLLVSTMLVSNHKNLSYPSLILQENIRSFDTRTPTLDEYLTRASQRSNTGTARRRQMLRIRAIELDRVRRKRFRYLHKIATKLQCSYRSRLARRLAEEKRRAQRCCTSSTMRLEMQARTSLRHLFFAEPERREEKWNMMLV